MGMQEAAKNAMLLVAAVVLALSAGCASGESSSTTPVQAATEATATEPEPAVTDIGDTASFTLSNGQTGTVQLGRSRSVGDDNAFSGYYLQVRIANTGTKPIDTSAWSFDDEPGFSTDGDFEAGVSPLEFPDELKAGQEAAGWIIVESSDEASVPDTLTLTAGDEGVLRFSLAKLTSGGVEIPGLDAKLAAQARRFKAEADAAYDQSTVEYSEYKQVRNGMSLKQVRKIIGFGGKESVSSGSYKIVDWANDDGSNMSVTFRNGRVVSKAQAGLN
jgi:hypothetical protein